MIGGVVFPPLLGRAIDVFDVRSVPLLLFGLAVVCAALSVWLRGNAPDRVPDSPGARGAQGT